MREAVYDFEEDLTFHPVQRDGSKSFTWHFEWPYQHVARDYITSWDDTRKYIYIYIYIFSL